ncbi:MAG: Hpt domain-containing protein [Spirochaetaceae bacterium]|nr:MAG: Hpt domain-containing protein [Spirochaetaceae bacterium]
MQTDRPAENVFSLTELLEKLDGDIETCKSIVSSAMQRFTTYFQDIQKAASANNLKTVIEKAHAIKGAAGNLCFYELYAASAKLEEIAEQSTSAESCQAAIEQLNIAWDKLQNTNLWE